MTCGLVLIAHNVNVFLLCFLSFRRAAEKNLISADAGSVRHVVAAARIGSYPSRGLN